MDQAKDRVVHLEPRIAARRAPESRPPAGRGLPKRSLQAVVARVHQDAALDPGDYLESCEVPGGGE